MSPWGSAAFSGAREVQALRIEPTLHPQRWSLEGPAPAGGGALSRCVHLASGRGQLWHAEGELPLRGGDIVWLPAGQARALRVDAGASGLTVGVTDALLAAAAGDRPDAAPLRAVGTRLVMLGGVEPAARDELVRSLQAMEAEARSGASVSRPYLVAHLTLVLVALWRQASHTGVEAAAAPGQGRLLRFRHLVEAQFRHHWPVARYAQELTISADRLHDLCVRTLGRPPLALVHQRVVREACSLLAGTDLSVEHVAQDLGFGSGSHFSRFFRRWTGSAPGQWRRQTRALAAAGRPPAPTSYADWP
ncbi:MAG: helix-turn-helix transcriptional regulator [Burkholderiaceae bacterium]|nr:helix-turn-helix transcriptional regulator [Burkholderiaceae bacterium]